MTPPTPLQYFRPEELVPDEFDVLCEKCAYSLVGLACDRCPECGYPFDYTQLPLARVPWLYRRRFGKRVAFGRTWTTIVRNPRKFAVELCRPVRICEEDARLFRRFAVRRVVLTAMLLAAAVIAWAIWQEMNRGALPTPTQQLKPWCLMLAGYIGGSVATWLFLMLATDLPTFIWRGLDRSPDDLAPLQHYACAPLAVAPLGLIAAAVALVAANVNQLDLIALIAFSLTFLCCAVLIVLMWRIPLILMRTATGCTRRRCWSLALYLPLHWAIMLLFSGLVFCMFIVPMAWYFTD